MHKLIEFTDGTLRTPEWLGRQPKGIDAVIVQPKGDSGKDDLSIAKGEGRHGNDCLLVQSTSDVQGLPGFWIAKYVSTGRSTMNLNGERGYLLPRGVRANRFSFWMKFDKGFRVQSSARASTNFVVGTYHYDPAKIGSGPVVESNNWHFYHQLLVRHDHADGDWINVVVNDLPQHQRGVSKGFPPANPTQQAGDYWEIATRIYIDCHPYMSSPEIRYPVRMLVDDISFEYVEPLPQLRCKLKTDAAVIPKGRTTTFPVEIWNDTGKQVTGIAGHRSRYSWTPTLFDPFSEKSVHNQRITLQPGLNQLQFQVTPREAMKSQTSMLHGVIFVPDSELRPKNQSHADPNVQVSAAYGVNGPSDCSPVHAAIKLTVE